MFVSAIMIYRYLGTPNRDAFKAWDGIKIPIYMRELLTSQSSWSGEFEAGSEVVQFAITCMDLQFGV